MKKEVSIVLSREVVNYRKLAQRWYGLTDEQMVGMDVHHNPARHEGGRNIPEHLFVYHKTLHSAVHSLEFILWQSKASVEGGNSCKNKKVGIHGVSKEQTIEWGKRGGETNKRNKTGVCNPLVQQRGVEAARHSKTNKKPVICINIDTGEERIFASGQEAARQLKICPVKISQVARGVYESAGGWRVRFQGKT